MNFGNIPVDFLDYQKSRIVILPVPFDTSSTWIKGADKGPDALFEASAHMELYDIETNSKVYELGIFTGKEINALDSINSMIKDVETRINKYLDDDKFVVTIGGNHSVSIGAFRAFFKKYNDLTILQLDAHADMRSSYRGSKFNHACVMTRAKELCPIVQVGIRSMSEKETNSFEKNNIFFAHNIIKKNDWFQKAHEQLKEKVYITIDLDVFDPSIMPSTGTPEPGGLLYNEVLNFIKFVVEHHQVVGFDIVELCPNQNNKSPDFMAAKLIYQILSYRFNVKNSEILIN